MRHAQLPFPGKGLIAVCTWPETWHSWKGKEKACINLRHRRHEMADFFKKCRAKARTGNIAVFLTSFDQILKLRSSDHPKI